MNKLTFKDYIDLEKLMAEGKSPLEQQCFLLSRYYNLSLEQIKNMDMSVINSMMKELEKYIERTNNLDLNERDLNNEIREIKKEDNKKDRVNDRSEILDL